MVWLLSHSILQLPLADRNPELRILLAIFFDACYLIARICATLFPNLEAKSLDLGAPSGSMVDVSS